MRRVRRSDDVPVSMEPKAATAALGGTGDGKATQSGQRLVFPSDLVRRHEETLRAKLEPVNVNDLTGVYIGGWRWQWEVESPDWIWSGHTGLYRIAPGTTTATLVASPAGWGQMRAGAVTSTGGGSIVAAVGPSDDYPGGAVVRSTTVPPKAEGDWSAASVMDQFAPRVLDWSSNAAHDIAGDGQVLVGLFTTVATAGGFDYQQHQIRSTDGGASWTVAAGVTHNGFAVNQVAYTNGRFYRWVNRNISGAFYIDYSDDQGQSWTTINTGLTDVELADVIYHGDGRWTVHDSSNTEDIFETLNDFSSTSLLASLSAVIRNRTFRTAVAAKGVYTNSPSSDQLYYTFDVGGSLSPLLHTIVQEDALGLPSTSPYGTPNLLDGGAPFGARAMQTSGELVIATDGYAMVTDDDLATYTIAPTGPLLYSYTNNGFDNYEPSFYAWSVFSHPG